MSAANYENSFTYTPAQYDVVQNMLGFGAAAQLAGFLYFILTMNTVLPKYRMSSVLSIVVMSSAFLLLGKQMFGWEDAFFYDSSSGVYRSSTKLYSAGFRFINWCIDVPCLLAQLLIVTKPGKAFQAERDAKTRNFTITGLLMVLLGYVGQFYETNGNFGTLIGFGVAACVPFAYILVTALLELNYAFSVVPKSVHWKVRACQVIFIACWAGGYTVAYFLPAISFTAESAIARTILYTFADVVSKVIYGIFLTQICQARSDAEKDGGKVDDEMVPASATAAKAATAPHAAASSASDDLKSTAGATA